MAEFLAITYGEDGIHVVCLCPQAVRTPMAGEDGGVAGIDGMLEPSEVARATINALKEGRFMVALPNEVHTYIQRKSNDYDRWISGMQRLNNKFSKV